MKRLMLKMVFSELVIACRRATWPTSRSPVLGFTATTDGVMRLPSALSRTVGSPASITAPTEFVVPRSMPSTFGMVTPPLYLFTLVPDPPPAVSRPANYYGHLE
jgi:hypothetical protein